MGAKTRRQVPTEWRNKPKSGDMPTKAMEAIARRRRQMLVHSCIYYMLNDSIIDDSTWTLWAQQLKKLQDKFGYEIGFYDSVFEDWDGSSGHHLKFDQDVVRVSRRLLDNFARQVI